MPPRAVELPRPWCREHREARREEVRCPSGAVEARVRWLCALTERFGPRRMERWRDDAPPGWTFAEWSRRQARGG